MKREVLSMPSGLDWPLMCWYREAWSIYCYLDRKGKHPPSACYGIPDCGCMLEPYCKISIGCFVYCPAPAVVIKCRAAWQVPSDSSRHMISMPHYPVPCPWSPVLLPLHPPLSTPVSSWKSNLLLITFPTLVLVLLYLYPNLVFLIPLPRWSWPFMEILITITTYTISALQDHTLQNVLKCPLQFPSSLWSLPVAHVSLLASCRVPPSLVALSCCSHIQPCLTSICLLPSPQLLRPQQWPSCLPATLLALWPPSRSGLPGWSLCPFATQGGWAQWTNHDEPRSLHKACPG